jgi:hypothetical protein
VEVHIRVLLAFLIVGGVFHTSIAKIISYQIATSQLIISLNGKFIQKETLFSPDNVKFPVSSFGFIHKRVIISDNEMDEITRLDLKTRTSQNVYSAQTFIYLR